MLYVKNLPGWERALRILLGAAAAGYALWNAGDGWRMALGLGGAGLAVSGLLGFCPMCALVGRRLPRQD